MDLGVHIRDGEFTATIYALIKNQRYADAIKVLSHQLQMQPHSRAALSLLGYCYYYMQDYASAAECYGQLSNQYPDNGDYTIYYAQALYSANAFADASAVAARVLELGNTEHSAAVIKLQAAIKYGEDDLVGARAILEQCPDDDIDTEVNSACLDYKEGKYSEVLTRIRQIVNQSGYQPDLGYAMALCYYRQKQYSQALKLVSEIIEHGYKDHPSLMPEADRTVGNTLLLQETALVEAFNLKVAIEYTLGDQKAASDALRDMPPRLDEDLDPVTLHNIALTEMDERPADGFTKLQFLLSELKNSQAPPETFPNLLLLFCKYDYHDMAADVLAENAHLTYKHLSQYLYDFLDAIMTQQTSPDEAYAKFEVLATGLADELRQLMNKVQSSRTGANEEAIKRSISAYDEVLRKYIPVIMAQAKIYWDQGDYGVVERIFRKSVEFCSEHDTWRLNVAHTLFMQESKFKEAAAFYEPIVKKHYGDILSVAAIVLANLCVCYIMTNQNEEAEALMRKVEKEEERAAYEETDERKRFHLCIINLVIGTLYCSKNNYEFGISRVIKAMEPYVNKIGTDTWHYAKRCMISLCEMLVRQTINVRDSVLHDCLTFLRECELHGSSVKTILDGPLAELQAPLDVDKNTVTYEARLLRALLMQIIEP